MTQNALNDLISYFLKTSYIKIASYIIKAYKNSKLSIVHICAHLVANAAVPDSI